MADSGPHKQSILRNKEVSLKNAPRKPRDVTRPTVMVKRLGFRGTLPVKYKIDFWNNPITASILVWNQVVLNQSHQLGYLNSKLMLSWDCPFNACFSRLRRNVWKLWAKRWADWTHVSHRTLRRVMSRNVCNVFELGLVRLHQPQRLPAL